MELEKIKINGKEFFTPTIIDFSSLIELLTVLSNKCNALESQLNSIDTELNEKEKRLSNVEIILNINEDQSNYYQTSPRKTHKESISMDISPEQKEKEKDPKQKDSSKEKESSKEKIELNYTIFSELYKKVKDHDKLIKNIINTINTNKKIMDEKNEEMENNTDSISSILNNEIKKINLFHEKINEKIIIYDSDLDMLKDK